MAFDEPVVRNISTNELGRTGLVRMGGTIFEEFLPQLRGIQGVRKYKEMRDNSAIVGAVLLAIESLLRSVDWRVEPNSESEGDLAAARFLEECRIDMSHTWEDFISEVLSMLVFGWSYFETTYKIRGGPDEDDPARRSRYSDRRIGWRKFAIRAQDTLWKWEFDETGGLRGMWQEIPVDPTDELSASRLAYIPIEKAMLFRTTSRKNSPEGRSLLRTAYRSYHFLRRLEEIEAIGIERDLAGLPVAHVPIEILDVNRSSAATSTYNTIKDIVTRIKRDEQEGVIFPLAYDDDGNEMYRLELLSSGGRRQFDTNAIIQRYNQMIAMSTLTDFILLGHEGVGSFALSSDKTELFAVAMESFLDDIQAVVNRHAVPRLFALNDFDIEQPPELRHGDIEKPNLTELGGFVQSLAGAGMQMFPDLLLENRLREAADLPEVDPELYEERLAQQEQQEMMGGLFGGGGMPFGGPPGGQPGGGPAGGAGGGQAEQPPASPNQQARSEP